MVLRNGEEDRTREDHDDLEDASEVSQQIYEAVNASRVLLMETVEIEICPSNNVVSVFHPLLAAIDYLADVVV